VYVCACVCVYSVGGIRQNESTQKKQAPRPERERAHRYPGCPLHLGQEAQAAAPCLPRERSRIHAHAYTHRQTHLQLETQRPQRLQRPKRTQEHRLCLTHTYKTQTPRSVSCEAGAVNARTHTHKHACVPHAGVPLRMPCQNDEDDSQQASAAGHSKGPSTNPRTAHSSSN
jgi:hypothetical protein